MYNFEVLSLNKIKLVQKVSGIHSHTFPEANTYNILFWLITIISLWWGIFYTASFLQLLKLLYMLSYMQHTSGRLAYFMLDSHMWPALESDCTVFLSGFIFAIFSVLVQLHTHSYLQFSSYSMNKIVCPQSLLLHTYNKRSNNKYWSSCHIVSAYLMPISVLK